MVPFPSGIFGEAVVERRPKQLASLCVQPVSRLKPGKFQIYAKSDVLLIVEPGVTTLARDP